MKLHESQLKLIRHLARFNLLDYPSCLHMLDTAGRGDRLALSYAFRPLTKNGYLAKRNDGTVAILTKGRALFPTVKPLVSTGGGTAEAKRVMEVSRMAALMEESGVPVAGEFPNELKRCFIPSACWRKIAPGILSTTRFAGMLVAGDDRLAVYDIGDGRVEWQVRAEGSLFYTKYGSYETKATGMLLVCRDGVRNQVARDIIRQTMWSRRQLLSEQYAERNRPVRWSRSPIKLRAQYERVYLSTTAQLRESIDEILMSPERTERQRGNGTILHDPAQGDYERWPLRFFANPATDLLKYVYYFSAMKSLKALLEENADSPPEVRYAMCCWERDFPILRMYPEIFDVEGMKFYVYRSEQNIDNT